MPEPSLKSSFSPTASELIINNDPLSTVESYVFDPSSAETPLGYLYAIAETDARDGIGAELIELVVQALQREYYRDNQRGILASFESALHQANLVLHDTVEQGLRDWMGRWHVALGVLADRTLHISTAGDASIWLVRRTKVILVSDDLSYSPVSNPLRTFSQVASGSVAYNDVLYFGTSSLQTLFRREDLARFGIEHDVQTITTRLQQLYTDQGAIDPLGVLTVMARSRKIALSSSSTELLPSSRQRDLTTPLSTRKPLIIHRSTLRAISIIVGRGLFALWTWLRKRAVPAFLSLTRVSGRAMARASVATKKNVQKATNYGLTNWQQRNKSNDLAGAGPSSPLSLGSRRSFSLKGLIYIPRRMGLWLLKVLISLPRTSKIFAGLAVIFALALIVSLLLLQNKRAEDAEIQRASEILHDAQTKQTAAETALIYDNRDQAHMLLADARRGADSLQAIGFYKEEVQELESKILNLDDRLQKVKRASVSSVAVVGDLSEILKDSKPTSLVFVDDGLYTFNPSSNEVIKMETSGSISKVTATAQGIEYLSKAVAHDADKTIIFATQGPGIALFDTKDKELRKQNIQFSSTQSTVESLSTFGSRLYIFDRAGNNIYSFTKTLRGFDIATPWITDKDFPMESVVSLSVDGSIYTLHTDGSVRELFKGEEVDFELETIEPTLAGATKIITTEELNNLYVLDTTNSRVVIFTKKGMLVQQLVLDVARELKDIAISSDEATLYALDDTRVLAIPLELKTANQ